MNANLMTKEQKELIKSCKKILVDNGVPVHKIKFVLEPSFMYDLDNKIINPTYKQLIPTNKKMPVIEVNKPHNTMIIYVGEYRTYDNFKILTDVAKRTKAGVIVWANNIDYEEMIGFVNLDDAIEYYGRQNFDIEID